MQLPILRGVYADQSPDFRTSLPRNMVPVPKGTGISEGYMRPADGIRTFAQAQDPCRGMAVWMGDLYAVHGGQLMRVSSAGALTALGAIAGSLPVRFDHGFDRLAIAGGGNLYYFNGTSLTQVTDVDLGTVVDMLWVDGYYMTTDGEYIVVTELANPLAVNPLKYGSSEAAPDPIVALRKIRSEVYALNRNTIEVFSNVGGNGFPFARVDSAQVNRGCVGTQACAVYMGTIAFLGSAENEAPSVHILAGAETQVIATREIEQILATYSEAELAAAVMEVKADRMHQHLYVHLPGRTLVYDGSASIALGGDPVWFELASTMAVAGLGTYRARFMTRAYDRWLCGDPTSGAIGELVQDVSSHHGEEVGWRLDAGVLFGGTDGIVHDLQLVALTGRVPLTAAPTVWTSYSNDGINWSQERAIDAGTTGQTQKRIAWRRCGRIGQWRVQRFRGTSEAHLTIARVDAEIEPLGARGGGNG